MITDNDKLGSQGATKILSQGVKFLITPCSEVSLRVHVGYSEVCNEVLISFKKA